MDLKSYAQTNGGTAKRGCPILAQVAQKAGCSIETLYLIATGHKRPSAILARSIAQAANGEVAPCDLRPDVFGPAPEAAEKGEVA